MRFEAAASAGELRLGSAVRSLISLMDDPDSSVRETAALALGKIGGKEAQRALHRAAESEEDRLAEAAREALEELAFNSDELDEAALLDFTPEPSDRTVAYDDDDWDDEDEDDFDEDFPVSPDDGDDWDAEEMEVDDLSWVDEEAEQEYEDQDDETR
jgi:8-oxo-dGTP pyrophosphatase MutT (NUDIX family)